jgi:hypothetical protein
MAQFKIKYPTRNKLQRALQQEVRKLGLVDTGSMQDSIRVSAGTADLNKIYVTVNALYYFYFQDNGADLWNGGFISPQNITRKALESQKGKQFINETMEAYYNYMFEKYPILENASKINLTPDIIIEYNLFGDPTGKWNGTFEETIKIFPA